MLSAYGLYEIRNKRFDQIKIASELVQSVQKSILSNFTLRNEYLVDEIYSLKK